MDDRARIAPTPERLRYHASRFLQADGSPTFMSDWLRDCADEMERRDQGIAEMEGALGLYEKAMTSHVDGRDLLEELHPESWHYCDIVVRIGGQDRCLEGDWLKSVWRARKNAREVLAARSGQGQRKGAGDG